MVMARRGRGMRGEGGGERRKSKVESRKSETRDRTDQMGRELTADFTDCSDCPDCPDSGEGRRGPVTGTRPSRNATEGSRVHAGWEVLDCD